MNKQKIKILAAVSFGVLALANGLGCHLADRDHEVVSHVHRPQQVRLRRKRCV